MMGALTHMICIFCTTIRFAFQVVHALLELAITTATNTIMLGAVVKCTDTIHMLAMGRIVVVSICRYAPPPLIISRIVIVGGNVCIIAAAQMATTNGTPSLLPGPRAQAFCIGCGGLGGSRREIAMRFEVIEDWLLHVHRADPSVLRGRALWIAPRSCRSLPSEVVAQCTAVRWVTLVRAGVASTSRSTPLHDMSPVVAVASA